MPQRHPAPPDTCQTVIDFDTATEPVTAHAATVAEQPPPFSIERAWIDTSGKTRTWALKDPYGTQMAVITTKRAAKRLAEIFNHIYELSPSR